MGKATCQSLLQRMSNFPCVLSNGAGNEQFWKCLSSSQLPVDTRYYRPKCVGVGVYFQAKKSNGVISLAVLLICFLCEKADCRVTDERVEQRKKYVLARTLDCDKASLLFDQLVAVDPGQYIGERGKLYQENGFYIKALADFDEAVRLEPRLWLSYRAAFLYSLQRTDEANHDWNALIRLRTEDLALSGQKKAAYELGRAFWARARVVGETSTEGLTDLRKAAELDAGFANLYADECKKLKLDSEYRWALDRLVESNPIYLLRRAAYHAECNEDTAALADYNDALNKVPKFSASDGYSPRAWVHEQRGVYYHRLGISKLAKQEFKKAAHLERIQSLMFGFSAWPIL
jgi:tetratricopeptide (TPR) repeat protein